MTDDTTVNALAARLGYPNDANPDPYWIDVWVEVAYSSSDAPSISVSDAVAVAESVSISLPDALAVSKSEAIGATDTPTASIVTAIEVADAVSALADAPATSIVTEINVSDSTGTLTDTAALSVSDPQVTAADSASVADAAELSTTPEVAASEAISVADAPTVSIESSVPSVSASAEETVALWEGPRYYPDEIIVSEQVNVIPLIDLTVTDAVSVADAASVEVVIQITAAEVISITDAGTVETVAITTLTVTVTDAVGVSESVTLYIALDVSAADSISLADAVSLVIATIEAAVTDAISIADAATVEVGEAGVITLSVTDGIIIVETVTISLPDALLIDKTDAVSLAESVSARPQIEASASDTVAATDSAGFEAHAGARVYIVQFRTNGLPEWHAALAAAGAEVLNVPHNAHLVRVEPGARAAVEALDFVERVEPFHPWYRIDAGVREWLDAPGPRDELRRVNVLVFGWGGAAKRAVAEQAIALGAAVANLPEGGQRLELDVAREHIAALATHDDVQWIDFWSPPEADMNLVRQDAGMDWVETNFGYCGTGVRGEVLDAGIFSRITRTSTAC